MPNIIREILLSERERWLLWLPVGLGCGIAVYFSLTFEPNLWVSVLIAVTLASMAITVRKNAMALALLLIACVIAIGFAAATIRTQIVQAPILKEELRLSPVSGVIDEIIVKEKGAKLIITDVEIERLAPEHTPDYVSVSLKNYRQDWKTGARVRLMAGLFPPPTAALPGGFDFSRHFYFKRIGAVGFGVAPVEVLKNADEHVLQRGLNALRHQLSESLREAMTVPYGAIAAALMTGEKAAIPEEIKEHMRIAGLAHVLAISGMHLGLVTGILFFAVRYIFVLIPGFAIKYNSKKAAAIISLIGAFGYLAIAGFPVSAQRAYVMVALFLLAIIMDRQVTPMRSIAWAATIILLITPEALLSASFQLSFAATIAIIAFYERYRDPIWRGLTHEYWLGRVISYIVGIALTSIVAGFATAPFIIHDFNQFATYNLLSNLMVAPLVSFWIMPAVVLSFMLMPIGLEAVAYKGLEYGIALMVDAAAWINTLPFAMFYVPSLTQAGIALVSLGGLWWCLWFTRWRLLGVGLIAIGLMTIFQDRPPDILINENMKHIALQQDNDLVMVVGQRRGFVPKQWLEMLGEEAYQTKKKANKSNLRCDKQGCLYHHKHKTIAIAFSYDALMEDCAAVDLVLSPKFLKQAPCDTPLLSKKQLWGKGPHSVMIGEEIEIISVQSLRGTRPWVLRP